jgi:hypothetical protein
LAIRYFWSKKFLSKWNLVFHGAYFNPNFNLFFSRYFCWNVEAAPLVDCPLLCHMTIDGS